MRVLSLFDGMACGMLAMQDANIDVERYVAYEIDKYAVETAKHNFPIIEEKGDVFAADFKEYEGFDFIVGGSPCTYWSIAQTRNRETVASGMGWELFSQYVRALREVKPKYFIYENNKSMSKAIRESISNTFGFEPICINSALVSAQNRQRLYWVGIRQEDGTYRKADIVQPRDMGIAIKDILDNYMPVSYGDAVLEPVCVASRGRNPENPSSRVAGEILEQRFEAHTDGKTNTLTTVSKDNLIAEPINVTGSQKSHTLKAQYAKNGIANFITNGGFGASAVAVGTAEKAADSYEVRNGNIEVKGKQYPIKLKDGFYKIRKLTVAECKRLQTVPDWYEFPVCNSQAYKMLGNGWTVKVIAHLIKGIMDDVEGKPIEL